MIQNYLKYIFCWIKHKIKVCGLAKPQLKFLKNKFLKNIGKEVSILKIFYREIF